MQSIVSTAEKKGLEKIAITDHGREKRPKWLSNYFSEIEKARKNTDLEILTGMEVDIRADGRLAVGQDVLRDLDVVIGALHRIPLLDVLRKKSIRLEYQSLVLKALDYNSISFLAHPTSSIWIGRIPSEMSRSIVDKLKERNVAVEMNRSHNDPSEEFLHQSVRAGISITPSSDAHRLKDIGDFGWFENKIASIQETIKWIEK